MSAFRQPGFGFTPEMSNLLHAKHSQMVASTRANVDSSAPHSYRVVPPALSPATKKLQQKRVNRDMMKRTAAMSKNRRVRNGVNSGGKKRSRGETGGKRSGPGLPSSLSGKAKRYQRAGIATSTARTARYNFTEAEGKTFAKFVELLMTYGGESMLELCEDALAEARDELLLRSYG